MEIDRDKARQTRAKNIQAGRTLASLRRAPRPEAYAALALRARSSASSAIKLKCIECCGWDRTEAKACEIESCALFLVSRRLFRVRQGPGCGIADSVAG